METALLQAAIFAAEQLLKHAPELYAGFADLVRRENVTTAELMAERDRIAAQSYKSLVPDSKLP